MRVGLLTVTLLLGLCLPASAQWMYKASEDALTDEKTAIVVGSNGDISIAAKCWVGDPDALMMMVGTGLAHDASADYAARITLQLRADKGEIVEMMFSPTEVGGQLTFVSTESAKARLPEVIRSWATAKTALVVGFPESATKVPVKGSSKAVASFIETCGLSGG